MRDRLANAVRAGDSGNIGTSLFILCVVVALESRKKEKKSNAERNLARIIKFY